MGLWFDTWQPERAIISCTKPYLYDVSSFDANRHRACQQLVPACQLCVGGSDWCDFTPAKLTAVIKQWIRWCSATSGGKHQTFDFTEACMSNSTLSTSLLKHACQPARSQLQKFQTWLTSFDAGQLSRQGAPTINLGLDLQPTWWRPQSQWIWQCYTMLVVTW